MLDPVDQQKVWTLEIAIGENANETEAQARLRIDDTEIEGWGRARRRPGDPQRPLVGEELAVARALSELSHRLIDGAVAEIEESERRPIELRST
jgi:hypothetical protein